MIVPIAAGVGSFLLAKASGATDEEIAETVYIAMRLSMGQPYAYSSIALDNFDKIQNKEDTTDGFFFSKNITPQITDFHDWIIL